MIRTSVVAILLGCGSTALLTASEIDADGARGARLFAELSCAACHGTPGGSGPDLAAGPEQTPTARAAAMWSHAVGMWDAMKEAGIERPALTPQAAADIHAHLAGPASDEPREGDVTRGGEVFEEKLCHACHEPGAYGSVELKRPNGGHSAFSFMAAMWEHGDGMLARLVANDREWQTLSEEELRDLLAYLNRSD